jgi:hypothetical protein
MTTTLELLKQGRRQEIWTKHCGFLDLNPAEFAAIQERLLMEQIALLSHSIIGKHLFKDHIPANLAEFRKLVPLTDYRDYEPFLKDQSSEALPFEAFGWARTSGRSGEYTAKWAPYSKRMYDQLGEATVAAFLMSSCSYKGEVLLEPEDVVLLATAPPPYVSGLLSHSIADQISVQFVPALPVGEKMEFNERISAGFDLAIATGMDYFYGLASVLTKIGERFENGSGKVKITSKMFNPGVLYRLLSGMMAAKIKKRKMLPRDIWKLKGVMTGGTDTGIYRDRIKYFWGKEPLEGYASTEAGILAIQSWDFKGLTFLPDNNFLEFIPFEEHLKNKLDPTYVPQTLLMNELSKGIYELVFTNLLGGVFTRYRVGDLVEVISLRDDEININLPQFQFYSRCDGIIDLAGLARLTERSIWQVIESSKLSYVDWIARKEKVKGDSILHIYLELNEKEDRNEEDLTMVIKEGLIKVIGEFSDLELITGRNNLLVTRLANGSFKRYMDEQRRAGADLAHVKPPHMQPTDKVMTKFLKPEE